MVKRSSTFEHGIHLLKGLCPVSTVPLSHASSLSSLTRDKVDVQLIVTDRGGQDVDKLEYQKPAYVAVGLVMLITLFVLVFPLIVTSQVLGMMDSIYGQETPPPCQDQCVYTLVESIPENLTFPEGSPSLVSTYHTWRNLIGIATETIDIASFYWTLKGSDVVSDPSDWQGEAVYQALVDAAKSRKIKIRIAQNQPEESQPNNDTKDLAKAGLAEVRSLNFTRWFNAGILHTKLWIIDNKHLYVGSANMDWRALTQVKEMGAAVYNCSCLVADMAKLFSVYWRMGEEGATVPSEWPSELNTMYNVKTPMEVKLNNTDSRVFISSSPPQFCPKGRTTDISAILDVINKAEKYVYIAVMDYFPTTIYSPHKIFWPDIDDALRRAALERRVEVRLMASWWKHSSYDMPHYLKSLAELSGAIRSKIDVRLFHVPAYTEAQMNIPFSRVNHNKYMVTDSVAYIGTSNWSGDYFISTGGIGLIVNQTGSANVTADNSTTPCVQKQLTEVFLRDWNSEYAKKVWDLPKDRGRHSGAGRLQKQEL